MKLKPVVLKFGTGILACEGGCSLDMRQFRGLSAEIAALAASGIPCVVVSSAAVAAGVDALRLPKRPADLAGKQACAAVGQPLLMEAYARHLAPHGLRPAQLLLTHEDIFDEGRRRNASVTLRKLLASPGIIPIVNENDTVAVEELRFGDNDRLSAEVARLLGARLLILLTSADGLLARKEAFLSQPLERSGTSPAGSNKSPTVSGEAVRIPVVTDIRDAFLHVTPEKGEHSTGGMTAKLQAVEIAVAAGIETVIAHGRKKGQIAGAVRGLDVGTRFPARKNQKR
jgi:glutamate 5-kinase